MTEQDLEIQELRRELQAYKDTRLDPGEIIALCAMERRANKCNQRLVQAESAPTITPESLVRHGKWGRKYMNRSCYFFCSECHFDGLGAGSNYCPHCGAKMDMEASKTEVPVPEQGRYR